jgi:hypothetical protein
MIEHKRLLYLFFRFRSLTQPIKRFLTYLKLYFSAFVVLIMPHHQVCYYILACTSRTMVYQVDYEYIFLHLYRGAKLLITSNRVINMKNDKVIINKVISDRKVLSGHSPPLPPGDRRYSFSYYFSRVLYIYEHVYIHVIVPSIILF